MISRIKSYLTGKTLNSETTQENPYRFRISLIGGKYGVPPLFVSQELSETSITRTFPSNSENFVYRGWKYGISVPLNREIWEIYHMFREAANDRGPLSKSLLRTHTYTYTRKLFVYSREAFGSCLQEISSDRGSKGF